MEGRNDRRQFGALRIPAQLRVDVVQPGGDHSTQTVDVSQNGVLIQGTFAKELDDFVRIRVYLPPQQLPIEVLGRIARKFSKQGRESLGVQFIEMSSDHRTAWLEYISRIESLTLAQGSLTSTSHILSTRKMTGRSSQTLIFRFKTDAGLRNFVQEFQSAEGFFIPVPIMKSIGEKLDLLLVKEESDASIALEGEVLPPQGQFPSAERMGLKVRWIENPDQGESLRRFVG